MPKKKNAAGAPPDPGDPPPDISFGSHQSDELSGEDRQPEPQPHQVQVDIESLTAIIDSVITTRMQSFRTEMDELRATVAHPSAPFAEALEPEASHDPRGDNPGRHEVPTSDERIRQHWSNEPQVNAPPVSSPPFLKDIPQLPIRDDREDPRLVEYVRRAWPYAVPYQDLDDHQSRVLKNSTYRYDPGAPVISSWSDPDIWEKLTKVQDILINDLSPYKLWPTRALPSFSGDFHTVVQWTRSTRPTWFKFLERIFTEIGPQNHAATTTVALSLFPQTVKNDETPEQIARRLRTFALRVPTLWSSPANTRELVKAHLKKLIPEVYVTVLRHHRDKEHDLAIWLDAMVRSADEVSEIRQQPRPGVRFETPDIEVAMATREGNCRRCQKPGHWAHECRAPAPVPARPSGRYDKSDVKRAVSATFKRFDKNKNNSRKYNQQKAYPVGDHQAPQDSPDADLDHEMTQEMDKFTEEFLQPLVIPRPKSVTN